MTTVPAHNLVNIFAATDRYDPTRTLHLRNAFEAKMRWRFRRLRGRIRTAIIQEDCFGLASRLGGITLQVAFDFPRVEDKVEGFMTWLKQQEELDLLETTRLPQLGVAREAAWTDVYIRDSYKRGVLRANRELARAGYSVERIADLDEVERLLRAPMHADRVGMLYTRAFNGLRGITDAMDMQISQVLAQGLVDGDGPYALARKLTKTITGPVGGLGITDTLGRFIPAERRARMLARTEIIRAHHQGTIQEYRNWAVEGVKVRAEWRTAGFDVCPVCADLEGEVFELDKIENMIPVHPHCRCIALPLDVTEKKGEIPEELPMDERIRSEISEKGEFTFSSGPTAIRLRAQKDNVSLSAFDPEFELGIAKAVDKQVREVLENEAAFVRAMDRDAEIMLRNRGQDVHYSHIFTNDSHYVGAGSGGPGSAKEFVNPYTLKNRLLHSEDTISQFELDPVYVQVHEAHHAFGSHTEFDAFSDFVSADFHLGRGNDLIPKAVNEMVYRKFGFANSRAAGDLKNAIKKTRKGLKWLTQRNPEKVKAAFIGVGALEDQADNFIRRINKW